MWKHEAQVVRSSEIKSKDRRLDTGEKYGRIEATGKRLDVGALRSGLSTRMNIVRSGISRILGFPSKSAYFKFWKKLFLFDVVANVARVGGSLFLYVFAPHIYQMLPGGLVG